MRGQPEGLLGVRCACERLKRDANGTETTRVEKITRGETLSRRARGWKRRGPARTCTDASRASCLKARSWSLDPAFGTSTRAAAMATRGEEKERSVRRADGKPGPNEHSSNATYEIAVRFLLHDQTKISKTPPRRSCPRGRPAPSSRFRPRRKAHPPASTPCARLAALGSSPRPNAGRAPPREPESGSNQTTGASATRASAGATRGAGRALSSAKSRFFLSANTPSTRPLPPLARGSG